MLRNLKKAVWSNSLLTLLCSSYFLLSSCEPEVERPFDGDFNLSFSADTILFDTVFTETRTVTKRLKVYNPASGAITITEIALQDNQSPFQLYVNGIPGKSFQNVDLLGNDSLLLLIEATLNARDENLPFVVEDRIIFRGTEQQSLPVIAWGQDAIFLKDTVLSCETRFTKERPYLIFGSVVVDSLCNLSIDAGSKIFNHFNSGIFVRGSLNVEGTANERVIFSNDRLEEDFENAPGQWRGIYFLEGSRNNKISFADIRNAEVGLRVGSPDDDSEYDVIVESSRIENISTSGILAFTSDVFVKNCLINNFGSSGIAAVAGGNYRFLNNTIVGASFTVFREDASLILSDNIVLADESILASGLNAELINNIIWGNLEDEIIVSDLEGSADFTVIFENNLLRSSADSLSQQNIINVDPLFENIPEYDYHLRENSPVLGLAKPLPEIVNDLFGVERKDSPDLGAIENN